jgi:serine/threonine protein phosphatase 1
MRGSLAGYSRFPNGGAPHETLSRGIQNSRAVGHEWTVHWIRVVASSRPSESTRNTIMKLKEAALRTDNGLRLVKRLPANRAGRDFIVGDLHGCRKELDRLLQLVGFNRTVDRLISVGDLVDRGPYSLDCLLLLRSPWFHAVMGNHEQLMLNFFAPWLADGSPPNPYSNAALGFLVNGGNWALQEVDAERRPIQPLGDLLALVGTLPQIIVVGEGKDRYNVVHAELVRPGSREESKIWTDADIDALPEFGAANVDYPAFRWSRSFMMGNRRRGGLPIDAPGLSETYCGHSVGQGVRRAFSHICLDTGAFMTYRNDAQGEKHGLTLADVKERRYMTLRDFYLEDGEL